MGLIRRVSAGMAVAAVALAVAASPAVATKGTGQPPASAGRLIQLGSLGGGQSWAEATNTRGDIFGGSLDAGRNWVPAVWWHGRTNPVVVPVGMATSSAISDNGHAAGRVSESGRLFVWRTGAVRYLAVPAGTDPEVTGVNNRDQVIGTTYYQNGAFRAFLWQGKSYRLLPTPKGSNSRAVAVNNKGQIVGAIAPAGSDTEQAVLWQDGRMIRLGTLGGPSSRPAAINERGQVIGNSAVRNSTDEHPFVWQRGRMTDLLARTTATGGVVYALSDTGLMTGTVTRRDGQVRPVLWSGNRTVDIGLPGHFTIPTTINDRGDVAGMTWPNPQAGGFPFIWHHGQTTLFPQAGEEIAAHVIGIDPQGKIAVALETVHSGLMLTRSA